MSAALSEPLTVRDPMAISRILIVDDNKMFRSALRAELELHSGWHVAEAADGAEGVCIS